MVAVLLELIDRGITALPIHDGLLVADHHAEAARKVMLGSFREATGFEGVVTVDRAGQSGVVRDEEDLILFD